MVNQNQPQVFIGAGIGVTPLVSMFDKVAENGSHAQFIQVTGDVNDTPFTSHLKIFQNATTTRNMNYMIDKLKVI